EFLLGDLAWRRSHPCPLLWLLSDTTYTIGTCFIFTLSARRAGGGLAGSLTRTPIARLEQSAQLKHVLLSADVDGHR
ncbi:MAG TPA: hypothetical protein VGD48_04945, partial [Kutzneria sp.]